jgi:hypothetical protein
LFKHISFLTPSIPLVGVKTKYLVIGRQSFLVLFEVRESIALAVVGQSVVGVKAQNLLTGS